MSAISVNVRRAWESRLASTLEEDLRRVRVLANLLDAKFEVLGFKFGWDAIVGLVPVLGDTLTAVLGVYPIYIARKHKLGRLVQARMALNVLIDWAIGELPLLGDLADAAYKSNLMNADLLERAVAKRRSA